MRVLAISVLALLCLAVAGIAPARAKDGFTLDAVRAQVKRDHGGVAQLSTRELSLALKRGGDILLLDTREKEEFAVSRIPGAVRVDPGIWMYSFLAKFGDRVRGKTVVFYCSVGVRSSKLAGQVQQALKEKGAVRVFNLDGGVFAWHNEARPLAAATGATEFVHPFDAYWGTLIERSELARTKPGP